MAEQRCRHGFLRSQVACWTCDGAPALDDESDGTPHGRARATTDEQIAAAIRSTGSLSGAAAELGINQETIRNRARLNPALQTALAERPTRSLVFVDLTGKVFGSWLVLREAEPSARGNARWLCRHDCPAAGEMVMEAIRLRSNPKKFCPGCAATSGKQESA